ncbi:PH domain-containing protein [Niabella beijingensis]|uniref:PH domain-containing protein n=1 Tax=Niabella beijingensis TaxID=2872700 RepID=UPI001CBAC763|nr:PH domain-containing protein [Niabella beijingensis]MBZ4190210.1 PH domain-containing protein [Niabella beijingensis]
MEFSASYDKTTKLITALIGVLMLAIMAFIWTGLKTAGSMLPVLFMVLAVVFSLFLPYGLSVKKYRIDGEALIICRPFGEKQFPLATLAAATIIGPEQLRWSWRVFGSGGLFGYFGTFRNKQLGTMTWYLTRRDRLVLVTTVKNRKLVLSPDDPERFIKTYQQLKGGFI